MLAIKDREWLAVLEKKTVDEIRELNKVTKVLNGECRFPLIINRLTPNEWIRILGVPDTNLSEEKMTGQGGLCIFLAKEKGSTAVAFNVSLFEWISWVLNRAATRILDAETQDLRIPTNQCLRLQKFLR